MPRDSNGNVSVSRQVAVTGQTVLAEQVNVPFSDIQSMLNLVAWRDGISPATGNWNLNGFKITGVATGSSDGDVVTMSQLNAVIAQQTNSSPVGLLGSFYRNSAPAGWIVRDGGTIGSSTSGATNRANADTQPLYRVLWDFSNTLLPIQNSDGTAGTRGASADADFAANKRLPVFNDIGLYTRGSGGNGAGAVGSYQEDSFEAHTHTGTTDPGASQQHFVGAGNYTVGAGVGGSVPGFGGDYTVGTTFEVSLPHNFTTNSTGDTETRPKTRAALPCIKL